MRFKGAFEDWLGVSISGFRKSINEICFPYSITMQCAYGAAGRMKAHERYEHDE
jgi:hypothetical protein